ncbi:PD-(D/E)XK nuclease family protein [Butyrivibrio sp. WCD3002]|uniref:PD-(D/E)XK nuclease family protein n=1 Tax=Butyrivibrio sp. WCD3002 TaxID=1280676 RepID=UPI000420C5A9|nr:PD-(D/E)XK nuclease family protein [Butyrivibrio sp. WCD3002]
MLRFVFGASGVGKSRFVQDYIIEKSIREPERNFLIVVPDQFTMQTQMDVVKLHPRHGIMNIDALSFSRLSHRIFEEVGEDKLKPLDDMGKSLVLRRVSQKLEDELTVIGGNMHKMGYIDEVKSTISEFMQYRISPENLDLLIKASDSKGVLKAKLSDLQRLYKGFKEYIEGDFIAQEETMELLCRSLNKSGLIPGSVIVFDGFTGFTPIQYQVIGELLKLSSEVIFTCTIGQDGNPYIYDKDAQQELFLLSKKTVHDILRLEYENEKETDPSSVPDFDRWAEYRCNKAASDGTDVFVKPHEKSRHADNPELSFLEQHLFRYGKASYDGKADGIRIFDADDVRNEVRMAFSGINGKIRGDLSLHYRDFAIVCGDIERYSKVIEEEAERSGVPVYIDQTGNIKLNPLIEFIKSALLVDGTGYSYETVFHYLRSGIPDFTYDEIDELENYVRALGIRGRKAWENDFTRLPSAINKKLRKRDDKEELRREYLLGINELRKRVVGSLSPVFSAEDENALSYSMAVYELLKNSGAASKMESFAKSFHDAGDEIRAKEYSVIYKKVINLLDQITILMADEKLTLEEYLEILEVGFGDIEIGTIPQSVDRIVVGDIERTRLKEVKYLFFLGVNDDLIPKGAGTGGIISDIERQFLVDSNTGIEMAPTPRQQMYIQRLYLYMNLTKPSKGLFLSYSHLTPDGKSIGPAYIIGKIKGFFPNAQEISFTELSGTELLSTPENAFGYMSENIQRYVNGYMKEQEESSFKALYAALNEKSVEGKERLSKLLNAAGFSYRHKPLSDAVSSMIYGNILVNSVSRLEKFAQCAYAHFLRYGLGIEEREEFAFDYSDMGNVFHGVLEGFSNKLTEKNLTWTSFDDEQGKEILDEVFDAYAGEYGEGILSSTMRGEASKARIKRILYRSIDTLRYQLQKGSFMPKYVEAAFDSAGSIDAINVNLTEDEKGRILKKMKLTGKIDRVDTYEDADHVFVKVIDFKSGNKKIDLCALYYGLQLQLVMYMNVARGMEAAKRPGKEIVPAAVLYYHINDPVLEGKDFSEQPSDEEINAIVRKELRPSGIIQENREIVDILDHEPGQESDVIHVKFKNDGSFTKKGSEVMAASDFEEVSDYVKKLIKKSGQDIVSGDVEINPYELDNKNACTYCSFHSVCGYDEGVRGYRKRQLKKLSDEEILEKIKTEDIETDDNRGEN